MIKKRTQEAVNNAAFFKVIKNPKLNAEINNLLPWYKVKNRRKTHFIKQSITWHLHLKKVTSKKLVKSCQSILQRINKAHLNINVNTLLQSLR